MPRITSSIVIERPAREVFEITNEIENWPALFDEYSRSQIIKREAAGRFTKLVFRLANAEGYEWQSWRILDHKDLVAIAEREAPLYPFAYMHLKWSYQDVPEGTLMTWTQDFEPDPNSGLPVQAMAERMEAHGRENQQRIKELIEQGAAYAATAGDV